MLRKKWASIGTAVCVGVASLIAAPPAANADQTPARALPGLECQLWANGVSSTGQIVQREYATKNGKATITTDAYGPGRMSFVPRTMVTTGFGALDGFLDEHSFASSSDGYFYAVDAIGKTSFDDVKITETRLGAGWSGIRLAAESQKLNMSSGGGVTTFYGISDSGGMYQYKVGDYRKPPHSRVTASTKGWQVVKTFTFSRQIFIKGTNRIADVFLATLKDGKLVEYTVPLDKPAQWTRKDLRPSGWGHFNYVASVWCRAADGKESPSRMLLGVHDNGDVYLYLDKKTTDGSGADIVGYGRIATGWTQKYYF